MRCVEKQHDMQKIFFILALVVAAISCNAVLKSNWPSTAPDDLQITYSREGGYAPRFEKCVFTEEKCSYSYEFGKTRYAFDFVLPESELRLLYEALRRSGFEHIKEDDKKIYDHIYERIVVDVDGKQISKTDNGGIDLGSARSWESSLSPIKNIIEREKKKRNITTY